VDWLFLLRGRAGWMAGRDRPRAPTPPAGHDVRVSERAMLVLSRKVGQELAIGDAGRVVVLSARRRSVLLGLDFPPDVEVYRMELLERKSPHERSDANGRNAKNGNFETAG
jgi:carbon storage regulator CsrA